MEIKSVKKWEDWIKMSTEILNHPEKHGKELKYLDGSVYIVAKQN